MTILSTSISVRARRSTADRSSTQCVAGDDVFHSLLHASRDCARCGLGCLSRASLTMLRGYPESAVQSALVGIFMIVCSAGLYVNNRDLAAHGVRTQGQVVEADASGSDMVVYTVGGTDYQVPAPEVGDRLPGEAVTVVYDPRDPAISNLEDDWRAWTSHWVFLGFGLFLLGWPAMPVVAGVFEADGPVGRRLARARPARRQPGTPPTPPGPSDREPPPARQALPEPYVPGSGDRVPAELRLVLAGYVGLACGLFATALACATAFAFHFRLDGPVYGLLFSLAVGAFAGGLWRGLGLGLWRAFKVSGFPGCSGGPAIHARPRWWPRSVMGAR